MSSPSSAASGRGTPLVLCLAFVATALLIVIGFLSEGQLPELASRHGESIDAVIGYLLVTTGVLFLLGHGANLAIISASRSQIGLKPPVLLDGVPTDVLVDPLPQALILTAIVIGFAIQAFLLTLLVITWRRSGTIETSELAIEPGHA